MSDLKVVLHCAQCVKDPNPMEDSIWGKFGRFHRWLNESFDGWIVDYDPYFTAMNDRLGKTLCSNLLTADLVILQACLANGFRSIRTKRSERQSMVKILKFAELKNPNAYLFVGKRLMGESSVVRLDVIPALEPDRLDPKIAQALKDKAFKIVSEGG